MTRQPHRERRTFPRNRIQPDRSAMAPGQRPRDREPQSAAALRPRPRLVHTGKPLEDALLFASGMPGPSSDTRSSTKSRASRTVTVTRVPECVCAIALSTRIRTIRTIAAASPSTETALPASTCSATPRFSAIGASARVASSTSARRSRSTRSIGACATVPRSSRSRTRAPIRDASSAIPSTTSRSSAMRWSGWRSSTSAELRTTAIGVRSSCDASAMKRSCPSRLRRIGARARPDSQYPAISAALPATAPAIRKIWIRSAAVASRSSSDRNACTKPIGSPSSETCCVRTRIRSGSTEIVRTSAPCSTAIASGARSGSVGVVKVLSSTAPSRSSRSWWVGTCPYSASSCRASPSSSSSSLSPAVSSVDPEVPTTAGCTTGSGTPPPASTSCPRRGATASTSSASAAST